MRYIFQKISDFFQKISDFFQKISDFFSNLFNPTTKGRLTAVQDNAKLILWFVRINVDDSESKL